MHNAYEGLPTSMMTPEQAEVLGWFTHMLATPTADGGRKRASGLKPSWKVDPSHEAAMFSHLNKWKHRLLVDEDNGGHPLVSLAWRALAIAWQETHEVPEKLVHAPRVFVAAPWPTRYHTRTIMLWLEDAGAIITYDWTVTDVDMTSLTANEELGVLAQKDIDGVLSADYLLLLPGDSHPGRGTWAEAGLALGRGIPVILWLDANCSPLDLGCIYASHPGVKVVRAWRDVLREIGLSPTPTSPDVLGHE